MKVKYRPKVLLLGVGANAFGKSLNANVIRIMATAETMTISSIIFRHFFNAPMCIMKTVPHTPPHLGPRSPSSASTPSSPLPSPPAGYASPGTWSAGKYQSISHYRIPSGFRQISAPDPNADGWFQYYSHFLWCCNPCAPYRIVSSTD